MSHSQRHQQILKQIKVQLIDLSCIISIYLSIDLNHWKSIPSTFEK